MNNLYKSAILLATSLAITWCERQLDDSVEKLMLETQANIEKLTTSNESSSICILSDMKWSTIYTDNKFGTSVVNKYNWTLIDTNNDGNVDYKIHEWKVTELRKWEKWYNSIADYSSNIKFHQMITLWTYWCNNNIEDKNLEQYKTAINLTK